MRARFLFSRFLQHSLQMQVELFRYPTAGYQGDRGTGSYNPPPGSAEFTAAWPWRPVCLLARTAIRHGAKGYIPCTLGFDITVEGGAFCLGGRDLWRPLP